MSPCRPLVDRPGCCVLRRRFAESLRAKTSARRLDPVVLVGNSLRLRDDRNIDLAGFFIMAGDAKHLAVDQAVIAADRIRNDVVEVIGLVLQVGVAAGAAGKQAFAQALAASESVAHGGLFELSSHGGSPGR